MKLLIGLGNPGADYAATRHNIGFLAVDALHDKLGGDGWSKKFQGLLASATLNGEKLLLLKPQTFMNLSGASVGAALAFYKLAPADILVFHDELELPAGKIRVKQGGGAAGHNGLKSIDAAIGPDYWRIRLGIGRPAEGRAAVHDYVLHAFARTDRLWLDPLLQVLAQEAALLVQGHTNEYMNRVTRAMTPVLTPPSAPDKD